MTVGAQLQQVRSERQLTFSEVTEKTKIQPWVLEAIEADRLPAIMSPIYVKGFVSTYARFLRLDPEPLLAQLVWPTAEPTPIVEELPPAAQPAVRMTIAWPTIPLPLLRRLAAGLAVTAAIVGLVIAKPKISLPKFSLPKMAKAAPAQRIIKPRAAKPIKTAAAPKSVPVSKPVTPPAVAVPAAQPAAAKTEASAPMVQAASVTSVSDVLKPPVAPALTITPAQPLELRVTATKTTWIKVWADGKLLTQQRLSRGAKERWTAKRQFQLIIAKPSQVDVSLNGQPINPFTIAHQGRVLITHNGIARLPESE